MRTPSESMPAIYYAHEPRLEEHEVDASTNFNTSSNSKASKMFRERRKERERVLWETISQLASRNAVLELLLLNQGISPRHSLDALNIQTSPISLGLTPLLSRMDMMDVASAPLEQPQEQLSGVAHAKLNAPSQGIGKPLGEAMHCHSEPALPSMMWSSRNYDPAGVPRTFGNLSLENLASTRRTNA